jgi:oligopeptide transport system substrate-binding protein
MRTPLNFIRTFLLLILFAGCNATQENVVRVNIGGEPSTLDPRKARDLHSLTVAKMLFEGLTRVNENEKAELAMAEKIDVSDDGKIYTFTLRAASWSNKDPVTAHDFVYAWTKVLHPHFPADQAFQLYVIKNAKAAKEGKVSADQIGVKALDDKTLQVELQYPVPYFLDLASLPVFFPVSQKIDETNGHWAEDLRTLVANGPFVLKEWKHNDLLRIVKNTAYWDAAHVKLKEIDLMMVAENTELKMYEKGELDWAGSPLSVIPVGSLASLKEKGDLHVKPFLATYFFRTNTESEPFQQPLMRKAFALAIKRSEIVEHVTQGGQLPATSLLPPSLHAGEAPFFLDGDTKQAQLYYEQALEALGLTRETAPEISLMYVAGERNHLIAQAVQEQWRNALGVKVQLQAVERKVFFDRISKKNFQLASGSWTADFNDGMNFLEVFKYKAGGSNNTAWESPRYRELLDLALEVNEAGERKKIFHECESILMNEMPIIPLFHYTMLYAANQKIKGVVLSNLGSIDFKWAYRDEAKE